MFYKKNNYRGGVATPPGAAQQQGKEIAANFILSIPFFCGFIWLAFSHFGVDLTFGEICLVAFGHVVVQLIRSLLVKALV